MKELRKRNNQIDVARGIAILIVILGHSFYSLDAPLNRIILSFHMPLFFFLSGLLGKTAAETRMSFGAFFIKKIRTILLPQILLGVISYCYYAVFTIVIKGGNICDIDLVYQFWRYWFLQVLFVTEIVFFILSKFINVKKILSTVVIIVICMICTRIIVDFAFFPDESPFYLNVTPMALMFYSSGFALKPVLVKENIGGRESLFGKLVIIISTSCLLVVVALHNSSVTMYNNNYGNIFLFLISSFCGIAAVWFVSDLLRNSKALIWCGKNSIVIYVWQFSLTQFFKNIVEIIWVRLPIHVPEVLMTVCVFAICVLVMIPIVIFSNHFIPELYGKKRIN